jgi:hypothetical protein
VKWVVGEVDQPVFSESLTSVEIIDEGQGEFVQVSQSEDECVSQKLKISSEEWPELLNAISHAIKMCQEAKP